MTRKLCTGLLAAVLVVCSVGCKSQRTLATSPATAPATAPISLQEELRQYVGYLASDELEGRMLGTRGADLAAEFIAGRFSEYHLQPPPGWPSFSQNLEYRRDIQIDVSTALRVGDTSRMLSRDYCPQQCSANGAFETTAVFAGYGIVDADHGYDDYAGLDVRGKAVLVLRLERHDSDGKSLLKPGGWSEHARLVRKAETAAKRGAKALLVVTPVGFGTGDRLVGPYNDLQGDRASIPVIHITQTLADEILRVGGSPRDLKALTGELNRSGKACSMALDGCTIRGQVKLDRSVLLGRNIAAVLPGRGPHADEYIVVAAHYDHIGRRKTNSTTQPAVIFPGADDNASGTAAVITLAERLADRPAPVRSILFITFTAEEEMMIGSTYFVKHSPVPLSKISAVVDMDMLGRVREQKLYYLTFGVREKEFVSILQQADKHSPLHLGILDLPPGAMSDYAPFVDARVPALFFNTGMHGDLHQPTDRADQINYPGMKDVVELVTEVVDDLARFDALGQAKHSTAGLN